MSRTTQFMALRPDPEDSSRTSVEMLQMGPQKTSYDHHPDGQPRQWDKKTNRSATWREKIAPFPWKVFIIISSLPVALAPIIVLATAAEDASQGYIKGRSCYPNGMWAETQGATWRIMDSSYFFTPNLSFGSMTFTAVKVVDISWDLVIGRGGQLLLAWVNWRVFNEWLVYHMEVQTASYKFYTAIAFETTTLGTLGVMAKEWLAFGERTWKRFFRWLALLCMVLSTLYVLSFPTLMAAMTGYITTYEAYVEDFDHNLIEFNKFNAVSFIIEDGRRIYPERSGPIAVTDSDDDKEWREAVWDYINKHSTAEAFDFLKTSLEDEGVKSWQYDRNSTWKLGNESSIDLPSPTLNITLSPGPYKKISPSITRAYYAYDSGDSGIFNQTYLLSHGACKPNESYQWGFSYIFLFMVSIFNFIWSCIMVGMWLDTRRGSKMYHNGRRPGLLRSIIDLSGAIREELGPGVEHMEEDELRENLRKSGGRMIVPREELRVTRTGTGLGEEEAKKRRFGRKWTKGSTF
ncbi:hypothetical protein P154DRAFT_538676 [Amniculicola lignicola CBS 123094]|uniref:Uncharacterized protein n=1 Tax=Amniculicola lignicola CBS 123094 TaxID=1392246 RepID=A0A6A5W3N1_9PLEO|nr:hypothetical protein P154DRAFT_538676 [Amniculicola lignicola CBS 123094]